VRDGLTPPAEVVNMTRAYFADQDVPGRWFDQCERCDPKDGDTAQALFEDFNSWCDEEGIGDGYTQTRFGREMQARGGRIRSERVASTTEFARIVSFE